MSTLEDYLNSKGVPEAVIHGLIAEGYDLDTFSGLNMQLLRLMNFKVAEIQLLLPLISECSVEKLLNTSAAASAPSLDIASEPTSRNLNDPPSDGSSDSEPCDVTELLPYLSEAELNEYSNYDKKSMLSQLNRYEMAKTSGFTLNMNNSKPFFIARKEEREKREAAKESDDFSGSTASHDLTTSERSSAQPEGLLFASSSSYSSSSYQASTLTSTQSCSSMAFTSSTSNSTTTSRPSTSSCSNTASTGSSRASILTPTQSCSNMASCSSSSNSTPTSRSSTSSCSAQALSRPGEAEAIHRSGPRPMGLANEKAVSTSRSTAVGTPGRNGGALLRSTTTQAVEGLPENFECIKAELPKFDVVQILNERIGEKEKHKLALSRLKTDGFLPVKSERKLVIRVLTRYLYSMRPSDPNSVTTTEKEGMAKSFVRHFPKYCGVYNENSMPWDHIYCKSLNTGWIANASRVLQNQNRQRSRKRKNETDEAGTSRESSELDSDGVDSLALLVPGRVEKHEILTGMSKSFKKRNSLRDQGMDIPSILNSFPHLISYEGEVLRQEFRMMNPQYQDMCKAFLNLQDKILRLPLKSPIALSFEDDTLRALLIISQNLPHDIPNRQDCDSTNTLAKLEDIIEYVGASEDLDAFIFEKRKRLARHVQPYLIAVRSGLTKKIQKHFLVLDDKLMQLTQCQIGSGSTIRAIDYLMMSYFVFNVSYPFGWRNTMHFLATSFYKVFEKTAPKKRKDSVTPSERELLLLLANN
ncbi:putative disease resistance protein [Frankliniella fusca]|uniref:Disease resistance protein n=1 Tax=Frankliniella fusca TaxID=407009 RepID=A0AAE1HQN8_9NEOP|nr:putative disease resistance protein [Frankliniella fusca]